MTHPQQAGFAMTYLLQRSRQHLLCLPSAENWINQLPSVEAVSDDDYFDKLMTVLHQNSVLDNEVFWEKIAEKRQRRREDVEEAKGIWISG